MNAAPEDGRPRRRREQEEDFPDGCTRCGRLPEASADDELLHGQNWDWRRRVAETGVLLRVRADDGPCT